MNSIIQPSTLFQVLHKDEDHIIPQLGSWLLKSPRFLHALTYKEHDHNNWHYFSQHLASEDNFLSSQLLLPKIIPRTTRFHMLPEGTLTSFCETCNLTIDTRSCFNVKKLIIFSKIHRVMLFLKILQSIYDCQF